MTSLDSSFFLNDQEENEFVIDRLLDRERINFDLSFIHNAICGKRILITGGAGSIGSELCKQVLKFDVDSVIVVDRCENYLHELKVSLGMDDKRVLYHYASITDFPAIDAILREYKPQLVLHAGAHKHVPIMEENVIEAVVNNFVGTKIVSDLSKIHGVEKFVLLSTDKVVNPSSVMGKTKKIAERYIRELDGEGLTCYLSVRFGNVLGSRGSVIPLFWSQIKKGEHITLTHPEMQRYFMFIEEAAQLILQAVAIARRHDVFLLEMGKPLKILELAKRMIRLAGYEPYRDVDIKYIGVRPGEKLVEELVGQGESLVSTENEMINRIQSELPCLTDWEEWSRRLEILLA